MVLKKYLLSAACLLAMQGAMAQVDGVIGTSVQAANTSCCKGKKDCSKTPAGQLKTRLQKLLGKGIMLVIRMTRCMVPPGNGMKERATCSSLRATILQ